MIVLFALLLGLVPIHGLVIEMHGDRSAIVRIDPVPKTMPGQIRRYALAPPANFRSGTSIDALLDPTTQPPALRDPVPAARLCTRSSRLRARRSGTAGAVPYRRPH